VEEIVYILLYIILKEEKSARVANNERRNSNRSRD
jgi:hypothetical protein